MEKGAFIETLNETNIHLTQTQIDQLEMYMHMLQAWNKKMNLTSITEEAQVWEKHFFDSIMPFAGLSFQTCCDVGSGAGFPGIPIAIAFSNVEVALIEPLKKRCRFLQAVKEELGIPVKIYNERAEDHVKKHREQYEIVTSRAVARMTVLLELCTPLVQVNRWFVALKGKKGHEEIRAAKRAMEMLHISLDHETIIQVDDAEHVNFYLKKKGHTPKQYPRMYGQIKKKPLGE